MSFDFTISEPEQQEAPAQPVLSDPPSGLIVTDTAAEWILKLLEAEQKATGQYALRITVLGGGCSGYMYDIKFDQPGEEDFLYANGQARVCIDPKSLAVIDGSRVEYFHRLQGAGFTVVNPSSTGTCGCGLSFSV